MWNVWEIGQGRAVCLPAFNLHQGIAIYHLSKVKALLSTEEWAEIPWLRTLRAHTCSSQKNLMGFLGFKCACLDTVCSGCIWLSLHICQIHLQDGLLRDVVGAEEACFFAKLSSNWTKRLEITHMCTHPGERCDMLMRKAMCPALIIEWRHEREGFLEAEGSSWGTTETR